MRCLQRLAGILWLTVAPVVGFAQSTPPPKQEGPAAAVSKSGETKLDRKAADARPVDETAPSATDKPKGPEPHIALLLPLESGGLATVASALRDGFVAAADYDGKAAAPYQIYALADDDAALAVTAKKAVDAGAVMLVAGITRDGARRLANTGSGVGVPILALNQPPDTAAVPESYFYLSLAIDLEAKDAAFAAFNDGIRSALLITTKSALSTRIADAFEREWLRVGGTVSKRVSFNGSPQDAASLRAKTLDLAPEMLFYALDVREARTARPYLPNVRSAFGTSLMTDFRADAVSNLDLAGTRFMEMPWFVQLDHPAVAIYPRPKRGVGYEIEKLYALGIDAYRVAINLLKPRAKRDVIIDGVTGKLELIGNAVQRQPLWVEYVDGRLSLR